MNRALYADSIADFLKKTNTQIQGELSQTDGFNIDKTQRNAWEEQITILKNCLSGFDGKLYFEYDIPRMGARIDTVVIIQHVLFVVEFKVGETQFLRSNVNQVWDYSLELKNFHQTSHSLLIAPVLVATNAKSAFIGATTSQNNDNVLDPILTNAVSLRNVFIDVLETFDGDQIDVNKWARGKYSPTPTIIQAATALYNNHSVTELSRRDASAINLRETSAAVSKIIEQAKTNNEKVICFVTGVPGAGKTLVGLDIATKNLDANSNSTSVFLSGNGPLVAILREALARDRVKREKERGKKIPKGEVLRNIKAFIQNVHHFRDEYIKDTSAPTDRVAIFDEAQRAWNVEQTSNFMIRKKGIPGFKQSEPEFLISCMDRHRTWAVIVCLVGGGQEINTGEGGIAEWIHALNRSFPNWKLHISTRLEEGEYGAKESLKLVSNRKGVTFQPELHLAVSMRSFRAEHLSTMIKDLLDLNLKEARQQYQLLKDKYPVILTRDLNTAKKWLRERARGNERYGIVVSSQAQRLKPLAIDVRSTVDPIHWFLNDHDDVRSSYYLEDVATEFHVQGLELDWSCVTWDADFRYNKSGWETHSFVGTKWQRILKEERKKYLKNSYRVLLTRARQGMIIVVPEGNPEDPTRLPEFYDKTFEYLKSVGMKVIE